MALLIHISRPSLQDSSHSSPVRSKAMLVLIPSHLLKDRQGRNTSLSLCSPMDPMESPNMDHLVARRSFLLINASRSSHQGHTPRACTHHSSRRATFHTLHRRLILLST